MSQPIENFKTVIIKGNMNTTASFEKKIDVEFIPDEVIIKRVCIHDADAGNADGILFLNTNMVYPNIIHAFAPLYTINDLGERVTYYSDNSTPNTRFQVTLPLNSRFKFWITASLNDLPTNAPTFDMEVALTFEFIKYKK